MLRIVLVVVLVLALGFLALVTVPRLGGRYMLSETDHGDVMTSGRTAQTTRTINILFVGNSFTSTNDLPAMLVNIAAEDPGNTVELSVKAVTHPGVDLDFMLVATDALAWAQSNPVDYVVLQEQSGWYEDPARAEAARANAIAWLEALRPLQAKPVLFESWADRDDSGIYRDKGYAAFGKSFKEMTGDAGRATGALAQALGVPVVRVGRAFYFALQAGARDIFQGDGHHAGQAGTYLAALAFYRFFTRRSGGETTYRPWGMTPAEAAVLVQASGR